MVIVDVEGDGIVFLRVVFLRLSSVSRITSSVSVLLISLFVSSLFKDFWSENIVVSVFSTF